MKLNYLEIENIRSYQGKYKDNRIEFPEGIILISGDIGSGKTSLLSAIEFGLFGLGEISGKDLLRRGENEGGVKLSFTINEKEYIIERKLQRSKDENVRQSTGTLETPEGERTFSADQLKARIYNLLGYPLDLVKERKAVIWKNTVYAPQENMKNIIKDPEARQKTLRKVFGVDKYEIIRQNVTEYMKKWRLKREEYRGMIKDLSEKISQKDNIQNEQKEYTASLKIYCEKEKILEDKERALEIEEQKIIKDRDNITKKRTELEHRIETVNEILERIKVDKEELYDIQNQELVFEKLTKPFITKEKLEEKREELDKEIGDWFRNSDKFVDVKNINQRIEIETNQEQNNQRTKITLETRIDYEEKKYERLKEAKSKCPVCDIELDETHRENKISESVTKRDELKQELMKNLIETKKNTETINELTNQKKTLINKKINQLDFEREEVNKNIDEVSKYNQREYENKINKKNKIKFKTEIMQNEEKIKQNEVEIQKLENEIQKFSNIQQKSEEINNQKNELRKEANAVIGNIQNIKGKMEKNKQNLNKLIIEINVKTKAHDFRNEINEYETWFGKLHDLQITIEREYMNEIKNKFAPDFQEWFKVLVTESNINVDLDEDFTPMIKHGVYSADYNSLSGGEQAAVALAYRLALNNVINRLMSGINTKGLIILDEPTDGFSQNQLENIKDILNQLKDNNINIILVSHEEEFKNCFDKDLQLKKENDATIIK